jgi:hypothetical protein
MGTKVEMTGSSYYQWNVSAGAEVVTNSCLQTDIGKRYVRVALLPKEEDLLPVGFTALQLKRIVLGGEILVTSTARKRAPKAPRNEKKLDWFYRRLHKRRRNKKWLRDGDDDRRKRKQPFVAR